jgi:hypothetical protein
MYDIRCPSATCEGRKSTESASLFHLESQIKNLDNQPDPSFLAFLDCERQHIQARAAYFKCKTKKRDIKNNSKHVF